jgi:plastocyanin
MSRIDRMCARVLGAALALSLLAPVGSAFAQDASTTVDMQGVKFVPAELHVAPGSTVLWTNSSPLAHTVTADDGSFDSGTLDAGATFTMSFDTPGTYSYFCAPHQSIGMVGSIVVDDPGAVIEEVASPVPARDPNPPEYFADH